MEKSDRQAAIKKLISTTDIARQGDLADVLTKMGFSVTQASVSRDLDELGVEKHGGKYRLTERTSLPVRTQFFVTDILPAGDNLIVIKCGVGLAPAAGVHIDAADVAGITGTIAGDDTIFIAVGNKRVRNAVIQRLQKLFYG